MTQWFLVHFYGQATITSTGLQYFVVNQKFVANLCSYPHYQAITNLTSFSMNLCFLSFKYKLNQNLIIDSSIDEHLDFLFWATANNASRNICM